MIGIIGGTGLYAVEGIRLLRQVLPQTAWGSPSDHITIAEVDTKNGPVEAAFLPRHGKGHRILPSQIPVKANMAALKMLGVNQIIAFSAVGSLKEEIEPTHFVIPDQIIDRTRHREDTFYGDGIVAHVSFGDPFCTHLAKISASVLERLDITYHENETLICMEGPAFSTRAESRLYKSWQAGIINMSVLPEAKLARELEMCYQMICMSTDYDSWRTSDEAITTEEIMKVVHHNSEMAAKSIAKMISAIHENPESSCGCQSAMKNAIITAPEVRPDEIRKKLNTVLPGYF